MAEQPTPPADLVSAITGRSDEEINDWAAGQGVEPLLAGIFGAMRASFSPERATGQTAVIQYTITTPDGPHPWQIRVADGACTVAAGAADAPRITLGLALADFLRLTAGTLDGMAAFMSGKLTVTGDMMLAPLMQTWFVRPASA